MIGFLVATAIAALWAAPSGQIAFLAATEQEDQQVCVLDVASREVVRVGQGKRDGEPVWSPDGQWIAYVTTGLDEGMGVRVVQPDGSGERILNHGKAWNYGPPSWSPDGSKLAYAAGEGLDQRVMVYDLDADLEEAWGSEEQSLLRPAWVTGSQLVAVGTVGEPGALTTNPFWVTQSTARAAMEILASTGDYVEWLPRPYRDTGIIAYESNDGGDREIFVFAPKRGAVDVSNHREADWNPVWSPDGDWIAFESFRGGRRGVYRVNPIQARVLSLAAAPDYDNWAPSWSPDGRWIVFVSDRDGAPRLHVTDFNGREAVALTTHDLQDFAPAWRPEVKP